MSKKRKHESKSQRKKRIHTNESSKRSLWLSRNKKPEFKMPESFEEAVRMGILI